MHRPQGKGEGIEEKNNSPRCTVITDAQIQAKFERWGNRSGRPRRNRHAEMQQRRHYFKQFSGRDKGGMDVTIRGLLYAKEMTSRERMARLQVS